MEMKSLPLSLIAKIAGGKYIGSADSAEKTITGVKRDHRQIEAGNMFVCIPGVRVDGHDFANEAFAMGATCCLAQRELSAPEGPYILVENTLEALKAIAKYYRGLFSIPIIGITGSVGKTTAKEMVAGVLAQKYSVLKTAENYNNEIGVPLTLLGLREEHEVAVVEMGINSFGEMSRLADIVRPDVCVMTNISYSHLENLGDLEGVLRAKSEVFQFMPADGIAVLNGDDALLSAFNPGIQKITFGLDETNSCFASNIKNLGFDGLSCDMNIAGSVFSADIPAFGAHNVLAALAAATVGKLLDVSEDLICRGLAAYAPVGGRSNVQKSGSINIINDCYNSNPHSLSAAVRSLSLVPTRKVAIVGDMGELGEKSAELHYGVGTLIGKLPIDCVICCGIISENIYNGFLSERPDGEAHYFADKKALFAKLPELIKKGDTVLVKASHSRKFDQIVSELSQLEQE